MLTICIRTDKPQTELYVYKGAQELSHSTWEAHRQLADTLHVKIRNVLKDISKDYSDIEKIIVFEGPGSFTGLRIGLSVVNALAYGLNIPIVGVAGDDWIQKGIGDNCEDTSPVQPVYGREAHITTPRK